jgi:ectoine hydroxylase-related dioxygenase (phytanoyl-CoA dioxygenase family)
LQVVGHNQGGGGHVILKTSDATSLDDLNRKVEEDGFGIIQNCLEETTIQQLCKEFDDKRYPQRNLLSVASVQQLARAKSVREIMEAVMGPRCFAVRAIFFNKTRSSNWKVVWHQDLTIAVRERIHVDGFGPWTIKNGVVHVQPPAEIMKGMLAIRLHLDESALDNGPLRVIPGSHTKGRLSHEQIASWEKQDSLICTVARGGALVMRPLLLHASSACNIPKSRRVIHIEFAAAELPSPLKWHDKLEIKTGVSA